MTDVLPDVLRGLSCNQIAIAAAIEELAKAITQCGAVDLEGNVRGCLSQLDRNQQAINDGIAALENGSGSAGLLH